MSRSATPSKAALTAWLLAALCWTAAAAAAAPAPEDGVAAFATIGDTVISVEELESAVAGAVRQKFYHGRPPEEQLARLRRDVSDALVHRALLLKEARRRGIEPDTGKVQAGVSAYERRIKDPAQWRNVLPDLTRTLEEQSIVAQLEAAARVAREPGESEVRVYYASHAELFTEPEQMRVSVILLNVDPSSPGTTWDEALERARGIAAKLEDGVAFAELARLHSQDVTADNGGDAGYLHRGMLAPHVEALLDRLEPGMVSDPVRVLEGVALFRLAERKAARLKPLADVRNRIVELWSREQSDADWLEFIASLRRQTVITIDERYLAPHRSAEAVPGPPR